jgi:carboxymethylenebutenolidase
MSESKGKSQHPSETDSTRRDLLVAGTAAAGAALLGASVTFGSPQSTESKSPEGDVKRENDRSFSPAERALIDVWERHTAAEFVNKDADAAIATMTERPVLIHVPVGTGATGREALRKFYAETFIPQMPPDATLQLLTRTVSQDRIIDEFILHLTHTVQMDWFAPGIKPTGRRLAVPHVGVIHFEGDKIASEHIYWDQATVLIQLGVLDAGQVPALGAEQGQRLLDPDAEANRLLKRSE